MENEIFLLYSINQIIDDRVCISLWEKETCKMVWRCMLTLQNYPSSLMILLPCRSSPVWTQFLHWTKIISKIVKGSWERIPVNICRSTVNDKVFSVSLLNIKGWVFWVFFWLEHGNMHRPAEKGEGLERNSCL